MNDHIASLRHYTVNEAFLQHWNEETQPFYDMSRRKSYGLCYTMKQNACLQGHFAKPSIAQAARSAERR